MTTTFLQSGKKITRQNCIEFLYFELHTTVYKVELDYTRQLVAKQLQSDLETLQSLSDRQIKVCT